MTDQSFPNRYYALFSEYVARPDEKCLLSAASLGSELDFSWPDKAGFITKIEYGN